MMGVLTQERGQRSPAFTRAATGRAALARERAAAARQALTDCQLCEHRCSVNRLAGETGKCHAGADARIFMAQVEVSDELELIPTYAIAFSGCDMRCDFCITGVSSWNARAGELCHARQVAVKAEAALAEGARTVMILGGEPTIHLPSALEIVAEMPESAPLIWKTNAHGSAEARALLDGIFDVWVADYKFGNDACAERIARTPDYNRIVRENLLWAAGQPDLIVRHVLMPGHGECCWRPVAEWLALNMPNVKVNLRSGFWPAWHASRHTELRGTTSSAEAGGALEIARDYGLNLVQ